MVQQRRNCDDHISQLAHQLATHGIQPTSAQQAELFLLGESQELEQLVDRVLDGGISRQMGKTLSQLATHHQARRSAIRSAIRHLSHQALGLEQAVGA